MRIHGKRRTSTGIRTDDSDSDDPVVLMDTERLLSQKGGAERKADAEYVSVLMLVPHCTAPGIEHKHRADEYLFTKTDSRVTIGPPSRGDVPLHTEAAGTAPPDAFGPFRVLHQVGAGTLGPVFRAYDADRARLVAVKVLRLDVPPERLHQLVAELERLIAAELAHPVVAAPIATGTDGLVIYLAQEYVPADSLDVVLRDEGPPVPADALRVAAQLAGALDFAAAAKVYHGVLHPRDVLIAQDETRLTGLGVAAAIEKHRRRRAAAASVYRAGADGGRRLGSARRRLQPGGIDPRDVVGPTADRDRIRSGRRAHRPAGRASRPAQGCVRPSARARSRRSLRERDGFCDGSHGRVSARQDRELERSRRLRRGYPLEPDLRTGLDGDAGSREGDAGSREGDCRSPGG